MWSDDAAVVAIGVAALYASRSLPGRVVVVTLVAASMAWTTLLLARYVGVGV